MTTATAQPANTFAERIAAVERAYEYMLAYAGQGSTGDIEGNVHSAIRERLEDASGALNGLTRTTASDLGVAAGSAETFDGFVKLLQDDARRARAMIGVVLAQPSIGSQMIDNLNASIHLRTLITDLFVLSTAIKARSGA